MDGMILIVGVVLVVLFGPWILIWRANVDLEREQDQERWQDLASRISALEHAVRKFEARPASLEAPKPAASISQPVVPSIASPPPPPPPISAPSTPISGPVSLIGELLKSAEPGSEKPLSQDDRVISPDSYFSPAPTPPSPADRLKSSLDLEEMLGTN
jgi:hypothetical protein